MKNPEISITIKPAPLADILDPEYEKAAQRLETIYRAAPEMYKALSEIAKLGGPAALIARLIVEKLPAPVPVGEVEPPRCWGNMAQY